MLVLRRQNKHNGLFHVCVLRGGAEIKCKKCRFHIIDMPPVALSHDYV